MNVGLKRFLKGRIWGSAGLKSNSEMFGSNYIKNLKTIGLNIGVNLLEDSTLGRSIAKNQETILYFALSICTENIVIRDKKYGNKGFLLEDKYWDLVRFDITLNQYKMLLLFYYGHEPSDIKDDPILTLAKGNGAKSANIKYYTMDRAMNRVSDIKKTAIALREKVERTEDKELNLSNIERHFIYVHNRCCKELGIGSPILLS